jgi:hypothetical protein
MKVILWVTVLAISMLCCSVSSKKNNAAKDEYSKIQFELMLPIIWERNKGSVNYIKDTVILYFNKHRLIYRLPYLADSIIGNSGDTALTEMFTQYNYYLFKDTLSNGYRTVNEYKTSMLGIAKWDSINASSKWYGISTLSSKFNYQLNYQLFKTDTAGGNIRITYVLKTRVTVFDVDTVHLTYSKKHLGDNMYSFALQADTIPGYKLTKSEGTFKPLQYEGLNIDQRYYRVAAIFSAKPTAKETYILDSLVKKLPPDF